MKTLLQTTKWLLRILGILALIWCFGGGSVLMFQDIPLLIALSIGSVLFVLPTHRRLWRPQKWWAKLFWRLGWKLGVIAGIFVVIMYVIPPFPIARHTTYLTEPRSTKFYGIDYMTVIEKQLDPGVPPSETGLRVLVETFGRSLFFDPLEDDTRWNHLCRVLDLSSETVPKLTYGSLWKLAETLDEQEYTKIVEEQYAKMLAAEEEGETLNEDDREENRYYRKNRELVENLRYWDPVVPCPAEALPLVCRWLDENDAALDVYAAVSEKPILCAPATFHDMDWRFINIYQSMAYDLQVRISYRLAVSEIDKAWDDVLAIYRLAQRHRQTVWHQLSMFIAQRQMEMANRCAEAVMIHSGWTSEEIRRKAEEIAVFPRPFCDEDAQTIIRGERLDWLNSIQYCANGEEDFLYWYDRNIAVRVCRMGNFMAEVNRRFDEIERRFSEGIEKPDEERETGLALLRKFIIWHGPVAEAVGMHSWLINHQSVYANHNYFGEPCYQWPLLHFKSYETDISLTRLVFLLEAYARENDGNYPETLEALGGELPLDPFSGKPFRYVVKPSEDGKPGFLLYSVGRNGIDEDGRNWEDVPEEEEREWDDIRRRVPVDAEVRSL